ncbi:DUF2057 family protein [Shewanella xiamenensis]|uniref:DUF2057 family protein n=1 Tax=Shewanella xiamenensis TaxID=332186 RepID=UPI00313AAE92
MKNIFTKKTHHILGIAFVICSQLYIGTASATTLKTSENLSVVSVNGRSMPSYEKIEVSTEKALIELKYRDNFDTNADDSGNWVTSNSLYLILPFESHKKYELITPTINTEEKARDFIKDPTIQLLVNGRPTGEYKLESQSELFTRMLIGTL